MVTAQNSEIGSFPDSWSVGRVDSFFDIQQGKQVSVKNRIGKSKRRFLRTKNVLWGKLDLEELDEMNFTSDEEERLTLQDNDLLLCEGGDIGRTAIWSNEIDQCYFQNHLHRLRVKNESINPKYSLYWFWYAFELSNLYLGRGNRTTIPNLSRSKLSELHMAMPPLAEQKKISFILSTVQKAIEQQEKIIQTTTELKKALMQKLFTEGLRGEKQKMTEIGLVPESWEVVPLGSIAKVGNGSTPKRTNNAYWDSGSIPWLNSTKIHDLFITEADQFVTPQAVKECHLPKVAPNSLLIAITGQGKTLGNSALTKIETCINQHLAYAQFNSDNIVPEFVLWFMQTRYEFLRSIGQAGGSTKGALTCGYLKTHLIPVPEKDEQAEIAKVFSVIDIKNDVHSRKKERLEELFKITLNELMAAKIRVDSIEFKNERNVS